MNVREEASVQTFLIDKMDSHSRPIRSRVTGTEALKMLALSGADTFVPGYFSVLPYSYSRKFYCPCHTYGLKQP
jgi:hypothetical protein